MADINTTETTPEGGDQENNQPESTPGIGKQFLKHIISDSVLNGEYKPEEEEENSPPPLDNQFNTVESEFAKTRREKIESGEIEDPSKKEETAPEGGETQPEPKDPETGSDPKDPQEPSGQEGGETNHKKKVEVTHNEKDYEKPKIENVTADPDSDNQDSKTLEEIAGFELNEDEEDYLELVRYSDSKGDTKGGLDKEIERIRKQNEFVKQWHEENPDDELTPNHPDLLEFKKKNPPLFTRRQEKKVYEKLLTEKITNQQNQELNQKTSEIDKKVNAMKVQPEIDKKVDESYKSMVGDVSKDLAPKVTALLEQGKSLDEIADEVPFHGELVKEYIERGQELSEVYLGLAHGTVAPDGNNETHSYIANMVKESGEFFYKSGGDHRFVDGKQFLPLNDFNALQKQNPEEAGKYWSFSEQHVLKIIQERVKAEMNKDLTDLNSKMDKLGVTTEKDPKEVKKTSITKAPKPEEDDDSKSKSPRSTTAPVNTTQEGGNEAKKPFYSKHLMTSGQ